MTALSNLGVKGSRRAALALAGSALLVGGLFATPAGAGQHKPHDSGSSSGSASARSGSSSAGSSSGGSSSGSSASRGSSDSGRRHAVSRGSSGSGGSGGGVSRGRTPRHSGRGSHHHGSHHGGYYGGHYYGGGHYGYYYPSYGHWWWNSLYSPWWWVGSGPSVYISTYPSRDGGDAAGALDLDVAPEKAEVYIDGELVGTADDYDGWPSYLWLDRGTYDVVFYLPGYKTMARQITVRPGALVDVEDQMERGDAVRPEDLGPKSHERRDARLASEAEKQAAADARERGEPAWRERVRSERWERRPRGGAAEAEAPEATEAPEVDRDLRSEPGSVMLTIEPSDAAVYLDGRFLGTADRLGRADGPLYVDPGDHEIEVVRPGYGSRKMTFSVKAGESVDVDVSLNRQE